MFYKIINKLLRKINRLLRKEDIMRNDGHGLVYLRRWTLIRTNKNFWLWKLLKIADYRVYIHKFISDDEACAHDHPNAFISLIFWRGYNEEYWDIKSKSYKMTTFNAPKLRYCPANHTHRVLLKNGKPCWSLVIMFPKSREWGFYVSNKENNKRKWYKWFEYEKIFGGKSPCE